MKALLSLRIILFMILLNLSAREALAQAASRNDHIFPPAPQAKPFINYDNKGFLINGRRTFIVSAGMEYARVPRPLWHDRLLRLKRGGYNTVEVYTFWNFHEPREGQFEFSGDHDLNAFLKLVKDMGMYAIVRVGPYYCGEWNFGGYPIWLKFKPGLRVREDNPQFLSAVDHFFDKLIPIVAKNQVNHGGAVIMVQLENEHRAAWGNIVPNGYFRHLINKTVSLGIQVPCFFSGLHSGNDPAGNLSSLDDPSRPNPWFSTEYWGVWFLNYGPQPQDSTVYDRRTWKIIAHGGNGYNVYMAHGGTNFDYNNDRDMAASYDYGASVGQAGDLRPIYYSFKRAAWFARSFQEILETGSSATDDPVTVSDTSVKVTARKSAAGTIAFLDNTDTTVHQLTLTPPVNSKIQETTSVKLAAGEIMPVIQNFSLTNDVKLVWSPTRVYGVFPQGNTTTILIYGDAGSSVQLYFYMPLSAKNIPKQKAFKLLPDNLVRFDCEFSSSKPVAYNFKSGNQTIRILAVNNVLASRSWFAEANGKNYIIIGPAYAADLVSKNNKLSLLTEQPWEGKNNLPIWICKPEGASMKFNPESQSRKHITKLRLGTWQTKNASEPVSVNYNDQNWKLSDEPLQMGADGDLSADAWYRARVKVAKTGNYILQFKNVRERAALFLDGKRIDTGDIFNKTFNINLKGGISHSLVVFAAHDGRNKQIFRVGVIDTIDAKGLTGEVTLKNADGSGKLISVNNWRMRGGPGNPFTVDGWSALHPAKKNSPQFYRTQFNLPALKNVHPIWRVNTSSLGHGSVWVNGHNLGRYPEKIKINGLYIPECWLKQGRNTLVIYDEDGAHPDKISIQAEPAASRDVNNYQLKN